MKQPKINLFVTLYLAIIFLPIAVIITILCASLTIIMIPIAGDSKWGYYPGKIWARILMFTSLIKVKIKGQNNFDTNKSYIFVSNHQSILDIFLIYGWLNTKFKWIMKKEIRKIPFVGKACDMMGHIFIDRKNPIQAHKSIKNAEDKLINGTSIVLFPEGTRTKNGKLNVFRRGAFTIAKDLNLPIVPLTITGAYEALPYHKCYIKPGIITLHIHAPVETNYILNNDIPTLSKQIKETINQPLNINAN